jgi:hypothetical protein
VRRGMRSDRHARAQSETNENTAGEQRLVRENKNDGGDVTASVIQVKS